MKLDNAYCSAKQYANDEGVDIFVRIPSQMPEICAHRGMFLISLSAPTTATKT